MSMVGASGIAFGVLYVIFMIGCIVAVVITVLAIWRAMKAHESIAGSMQEIAAALKGRKE